MNIELTLGCAYVDGGDVSVVFKTHKTQNQSPAHRSVDVPTTVGQEIKEGRC